MAIFSKDGKVYVLEGPNPLVKTQESWDPSNMIFHNFTWEEHVSKGATKRKVPAPEPSDPSERKPEIRIPTKPEEAEHPSTAGKIEEETPKEEISKDFDLPYIKHKVLSYCLPAKEEKKTDKFYGESWIKVTYGKKMVFPSVIVEATDFYLEFWTSDPNEHITEKSIIYPFAYEIHNTQTDSYDRVPYDEYRWWKVSDRKRMEEGGWLIRAVPSDNQPDFSD